MKQTIAILTDARGDGTWGRAKFQCRQESEEVGYLKASVDVTVTFDGEKAVVAVNGRVVCGIDESGMSLA